MQEQPQVFPWQLLFSPSSLLAPSSYTPIPTGPGTPALSLLLEPKHLILYAWPCRPRITVIVLWSLGTGQRERKNSKIERVDSEIIYFCILSFSRELWSLTAAVFKELLWMLSHCCWPPFVTAFTLKFCHIILWTIKKIALPHSWFFYCVYPTAFVW